MKNDLLDYGIIVQAVSGDTSAISAVLKHFENYINTLARQYITTGDSKRQLMVDEEIKRELEIELITKIQRFQIPK